MNAVKRNIYAEVLEDAALKQFDSAMALPYVVAGALMPDAHKGYTLPIGAVVATKDVIIPAWVGYDIGCGMCAVHTTFNRADVEWNATDIFESIYRDIPTGKGMYNDKQCVWPEWEALDRSLLVSDLFRKNGLRQLCSLGGGNHFIEIGYDEFDRVWLIVHSGSRNIGHSVASHYMALASPDGKPREGHFGFKTYLMAAQDYFTDANFCLAFALESRKQMLERVADCIKDFCDGDVTRDSLINRNHNHVEYAHGMWIHRKGATHAEEGMMGVIPGNMRDGSFIVRGKGNADSLWSSSHGAGRIMGREEAKRGKREEVTGKRITEPLSMDAFKASMSCITAKVDPSTIDESPAAYKDIFAVMSAQRDLVEVVHHIKPIINVKGK